MQVTKYAITIGNKLARDYATKSGKNTGIYLCEIKASIASLSTKHM
jgi:hypothetical protein